MKSTSAMCSITCGEWTAQPSYDLSLLHTCLWECERKHSHKEKNNNSIIQYQMVAFWGYFLPSHFHCNSTTISHFYPNSILILLYLPTFYPISIVLSMHSFNQSLYQISCWSMKDRLQTFKCFWLKLEHNSQFRAISGILA